MFEWPGNLKSHMRINHSKDDEVSCDQCDFSSSSRKLLKEHAKTHDPSRMFKCQQCPLKFPSARALRAHLCTHDPVKPYQCSFCPYACKRSGNLKKHVQSQHMDKLQKAPGKQKGKKRASSEAGNFFFSNSCLLLTVIFHGKALLQRSVPKVKKLRERFYHVN